MPYRTTRTNLEDIMQGKVSSHGITSVARFPLYEVFKIVKFLEAKNRMKVVRTLGRWMGSYQSTCVKFEFCNEKLLET